MPLEGDVCRTDIEPSFHKEFYFKKEFFFQEMSVGFFRPERSPDWGYKL